jgi:hypothetical protein
MGKIFQRRVQLAETAVDNDATLVHVAIAGGSLTEWEQFGSLWEQRLYDLVKVAQGFGVKVLSVYPYGPDTDDIQVKDSNFDRSLVLDGVEIVVHSMTDGRKRICAALENVESSEVVNEGFFDQQLFGTAGNPDLVIVLGPANCLPASLVWELAYGEIVFVDQSWTALSIDNIDHAIQEYSLRHRRFGGVDT